MNYLQLCLLKECLMKEHGLGLVEVVLLKRYKQSNEYPSGIYLQQSSKKVWKISYC